MALHDHTAEKNLERGSARYTCVGIQVVKASTGFLASPCLVFDKHSVEDHDKRLRTAKECRQVIHRRNRKFLQTIACHSDDSFQLLCDCRMTAIIIRMTDL